MNDAGEDTVECLIASPNVKSPERIYIEWETAAELHETMDALPDRESVYVQYRFGFADGKDHPLTETAQYFHLTESRAKSVERSTMKLLKHELLIEIPDAYTGPRAPSARSISPTLPERSPTIPRAVLEERPCQPRRRAEPGISHRSRGWGCRWQSKQSPVIECDSGKSVIPPAWHRRFPRIPVPLHAGSSNPIQGHRGNRRD